MHDYSVYGGRLRSAVLMPELRPRPIGLREESATATWRFDVASSSAPDLTGVLSTSRDELIENVYATLIRAPGMARLTFDDTGTFDLVEDWRRIVWYPKQGCIPDVARADLIGRVLPFIMHERGFVSLHASAVVIDGRAIAFLAPKHYGKSTLAMTLVEQHEARLLSDDTVIVSPETVLALPGVHSIRLTEPTAQRFPRLGEGRTVLSDKRIFETLPDEWLAEQAVPLEAIYTLVPSAPDSADSVQREALDGAMATLSIIQYQKLGALLAGADAARVFERAAMLASKVPVYALHVVRDLEQLAHVATRIARWHSS